MPLAQRGQSFEPLHPKGPEFLRPWDSRVKWVPLGLASVKGDERLVPRLATIRSVHSFSKFMDTKTMNQQVFMLGRYTCTVHLSVMYFEVWLMFNASCLFFFFLISQCFKCVSQSCFLSSFQMISPKRVS
jgi:hypothetical protein